MDRAGSGAPPAANFSFRPFGPDDAGLPSPMAGTISIEALAAKLETLEDLVLNAPRLHRKNVMVRYGFSESTLHRWMREGRLPDPIRISGPMWRLADLEAAEKAGQLPRPVST